jgi:hypothetical protein
MASWLRFVVTPSELGPDSPRTHLSELEGTQSFKMAKVGPNHSPISTVMGKMREPPLGYTAFVRTTNSSHDEHSSGQQDRFAQNGMSFSLAHCPSQASLG